MKSVAASLKTIPVASHPVRGAWIEIWRPGKTGLRPASHPVRGAWIEMINAIPLLSKENSRTP